MGEKCRNLQALRALSPAYAGRNGELTAILQYVYQSILLDGCGKGDQAKVLLGIAVDEMEHLEKIGGLLVGLGVPPVFTACPPYPVAYYSASNVDYSRPLAPNACSRYPRRKGGNCRIYAHFGLGQGRGDTKDDRGNPLG